MIYVGKVVPSVMDEPIVQNILDFLAEYTPQKVTVPDKEEQQKKLKTRILNGFISGEMSALIRKNENVVSRDCLILDLDDVIVSAEELKVEIHREFKRFDYAFFPSVSNGVKGVRYRLVLPMNRSVNNQEYSLIVRFFNERILQSVINVPDESNTTWSQIQLLPVLTQYNHKEDIVIHQAGRLLPVVALLDGARTFFKGKRTQKNTKKPKNASMTQQKKLYTGEFLDTLVAGAETGNRNNWIRKMTDKMLSLGADLETIYQLLLVANQHFLDSPLPDKEINTTFKSRVKNHQRKGA